MAARIAIVGAGAIGGYYGARLALAGAEVRFLLRGDLATMRAHGLTLREKDGTRHLRDVAAFATTEEIGEVDLVLVALKTTANGALARLLPPLVGPQTLVVTLQNGLGNEELLAELVGPERVLGGLCFIAVMRERPGELLGFHTPGAITLGEFGRPAATRTHALAERFALAGIKCTVVENLAEARWRKLVWNVPFNGLAIAAGGITTDKILADPALAAEVRGLMDEIAGVARRLGYEVPEKFIQHQIDVTPSMGPYQPSSLIDYRAGREVEVEAIWGEPLRRAQAAGAPVPRLARLHAQLKVLTGKV
ncbi:MAG: 2-dehydropantoate 2-reductase [Opitutaceae bacterium]|nr:2-dehydropantoate 2-reductase [Opitutaceae bacterium]